MYHVIVSENRKAIGSSLQEGLADAVMMGRKIGQKGNRITVYDSVQDATGKIVHLSKILSVTLEE